MLKCITCSHEEYAGFRHGDPCPLCGAMLRAQGQTRNRSAQTEVFEREKQRKRQEAMIMRDMRKMRQPPQIVDPALAAQFEGS